MYYLADFKITTNKIIIIDPSYQLYNLDKYKHLVIDNLKKGSWNCYTNYSNSYYELVHQNTKPPPNKMNYIYKKYDIDTSSNTIQLTFFKTHMQDLKNDCYVDYIYDIVDNQNVSITHNSVLFHKPDSNPDYKCSITVVELDGKVVKIAVMFYLMDCSMMNYFL